MITELTNENFSDLINNGLVLVDFYAVWCGPCKMMHPVIDEFVSDNSQVKVIKVDVDQHEEVARNYAVMSIPTLILFKNGEMVEKNIGFTPKDVLENWLKKNK